MKIFCSSYPWCVIRHHHHCLDTVRDGFSHKIISFRRAPRILFHAYYNIYTPSLTRTPRVCVYSTNILNVHYPFSFFFVSIREKEREKRFYTVEHTRVRNFSIFFPFFFFFLPNTYFDLLIYYLWIRRSDVYIFFLSANIYTPVKTIGVKAYYKNELVFDRYYNSAFLSSSSSSVWLRLRVMCIKMTIGYYYCTTETDGNDCRRAVHEYPTSDG